MFTLRIETDNAAFDSEDGWSTEVARILRDLASRLDIGAFPNSVLRDVNGNNVGAATYREGNQINV